MTQPYRRQPYSVNFLIFELGGGLDQNGPTCPADTTWVIRDVIMAQTSFVGLGIEAQVLVDNGTFSIPIASVLQSPAAGVSYHRKCRVVIGPGTSVNMSTGIGSDEVGFVVSGYELQGFTLPG